MSTAPLQIWTDGSCYPNPGPGGWAFVAHDLSGPLHEVFGGQTATTNNRMEMLAIIRAIEWADRRPCIIHSDSQLCVKTLTHWATSWKRRGWMKADGKAVINRDLVMTAHNLYLASQARVQWVRGHNGDPGNERADRLALQGRLSLTSPPPQPPQETPA